MRRLFSRLIDSLSLRLLSVTMLFVLVIGAAVYVPAITQFRLNFLNERLASAQTAALALEELPGQTLSAELEQEVLSSARLRAIIVLREDSRQILLRSDLPSGLADRLDLRDISWGSAIMQTFDTFARRGAGFIQVTGMSMTPRYRAVVFVMDEQPLYEAMVSYSNRLLILSVLLMMVAGAVAHLGLYRLVVRPMQRLSANMAAFRDMPEDGRNLLEATDRGDEIGDVERELARMQYELRRTLTQKTRLAALGTAVSKISHDLRNILAASQIWTDRMRSEESAGAGLAPFADRLTRTLDRAIRLCESTLKYGKADEPPPVKRDVPLHLLIDEVGITLGLESEPGRWDNRVDEDIIVHGDADQLFRVFLNLGRNAMQATEATAASGQQDRRITISAERDRDEDLIHVLVADAGPGLPAKIRDNLFRPFIGGAGAGTGLGLAIVKELVEAHGGRVMLDKSDETGTVFRVCLPQTRTARNGK